MYLFRLIYYSVNAIETQETSLQKELKSILISSQKNNPPLGVSGALIFNYNHFAQILEGDRKAVTDVFCRLAKDPRHKDLVILEAEPIDERLFENWNMAFVGGVMSETQLRRYGTSAQFRPEKMGAKSLMKFMRAVIDESNSNTRTAKAS